MDKVVVCYERIGVGGVRDASVASVCGMRPYAPGERRLQLHATLILGFIYLALGSRATSSSSSSKANQTQKQHLEPHLMYIHIYIY